MKKILLALFSVALIIGAVIGYIKIHNRTILFSETNVYSVMPSQTVAFVECKNYVEFQKGLADSSLQYDFSLIKELSDDVNFFKKMAEIAVSQKKESATNDYDFVFALVENNKELFPLLATKMTKNEVSSLIQNLQKDSKSTVEKCNSVEVEIFENGFATAYCAGIFIASTDANLIKTIIFCAQSRKSIADCDEQFKKLAGTTGENVLANLFINVKSSQILLNKIFKDKTLINNSLSKFSSWVVFDMSLSGKQVVLNGYADADDSFTTSLLAGQQTVENTLIDLVPSDVVSFVSFALSDTKAYFEKVKLTQKLTKPTEKFLTDYFTGQVVAGALQRAEWSGNEFVLLSISDSVMVTDELDSKAQKTSRISDYTAKTVSVYQLPEDLNLSVVASNFSTTEKRFACVLKGALLLAETEPMAHEILGRIESGSLFTQGEMKDFVAENFRNQSSATFFINFPFVRSHSDMFFTDEFSKIMTESESFFGKIGAVGGQFEAERDLFYCNASVLFGKMPKVVVKEELPKKKDSSVAWEVEIGGTPIFGPIIVKNPTKKECEILLQGADKKLYCYANNGEMLWSVALDEQILGNEIAQIDYLRNGKYQFVFNTKKSIYVVDRKGNLLKNFPFKLPQEASAPMSVFDYDGKKDYRFFVPCVDKKILLYNKECKAIPDWNLRTTKNVVTLPIQYLRVAGKDYILVNDGSPYILDRRGNTRVRLKSKIDMSNRNPFFHFYGKSSKASLVTTDQSGYLKQIDFEGNVKSQKLREDISQKHYFLRVGTPQKPVYVCVDNGKLFAYDKDLKSVFETSFTMTDCQPCVNGDFVMIYSSADARFEIFDAQKLQMIGQSFSSVVSPYIGSLLPMQGTYLLVVNENKLICLYLNK